MSGAAQLLIGCLLACAVAGAGYRARALSTDGAIAAAIVGTAIFGFGGWRWAAIMVAFFALSSALSRIGKKRRREAIGVVEKGARRDALQVLANGGVAALVALARGAGSESLLLFPAFMGAMAAATADTWSTEIGTLSRTAPRSILTWKVLQPGWSGGVTLLGFGGAAAGAFVVALIAAVGSSNVAALMVGGLVAGVGGSVLDSLLGAGVQRVNRCPRCLTLTEQSVHVCGTRTVLVRGWAFIDNDVVNTLATTFGALLGALIFAALT